MLDQLKNFRNSYKEVFEALPFLDCYISDMEPAWEAVPAKPPVPFRELSFSSGALRLVKHTDVSFDELEVMAKTEPEVNFIIASGDQKLLYHETRIRELITNFANIYLCTANLCNVKILEKFVAAKLTSKLLFGTMYPYLDPGQAIGPLVLGDIDWQSKCDIAGNNLRRLLGEAPVDVPEMPQVEIPALMIDAHGHTINDESQSRFPAPMSQPVWEQWEAKLDFFGITNFFNTPGEAISDVSKEPANLTRDFCVNSGGRVRYFEVYDPRCVETSLAVLSRSLVDPMCIGIKIHPAEHFVDADHPDYEAVFATAAKYGKPIMTHSWGVSSYNPRQKCASPEKFDKYLTLYPDAKFVFGHAGGRPNGFEHAVAMCRKHPQCMVDFAGDLFNNGFIARVIKEIGVDRVMFATDMYWIDPRCLLGQLMCIDELSDDDMLKILRFNAERFYLNK